MRVKEEWFRHFRMFLKENNLYNDFMKCFRKQEYTPKHHFKEENYILNYVKIMTIYWGYSINQEYNALFLAFDSFKWVVGGNAFPKEFTIKWCTVAFKWGIYCIEHNIEICSEQRFTSLIGYWNSNGWIDKNILTDEEIKTLEEYYKKDTIIRNNLINKLKNKKL